MMVHMNLELYGWASLPLVGFLFRVYGADRGPTANWCRPVLWVWSASLGVGVLSWLSGNSSGKLFLDWSGYARVLFPGALLVLWLLLVFALVGSWRESGSASVAAWAAKLAGLVVLLAVPFLIYIASGPNTYPPVNPDTGGPTGASQLESSLAIVAVLLMLPFGIARRKLGKSGIFVASWMVLIAESILCVALGRADVSHHSPVQFLSLGSLLIWLPLVPAYYKPFEWHPNTRRWRLAFLWWWGALLVTGWVFFLPGVLDHFKFTDGLVGHSFVAMAGFTSSLLIFVMVQLLGEGGWIFNRSRSFYLWNGSVIAYIVLMTMAGWREGFDPTFTIVPGIARNILYTLRLVTGILMLLAALDWIVDASTLLREPVLAATEVPLEKTA
jgi:cytochrome c oxidase cbb3-type subunit 1